MPDKPKRKQFRRAVSVSRVAYDRLKAHCMVSNRSMSSLVEELVNAAIAKTEGK